MESVQSFSAQLDYQPSSSIYRVNVGPLAKRNLSPKEEKERLVRKIEGIMEKNSALEGRQDQLQNTIADLRKLLEFAGRQSLQECQYLYRQNEGLKAKAEGLSKSLKYSHKNGAHLHGCALYWSQFLE